MSNKYRTQVGIRNNPLRPFNLKGETKMAVRMFSASVINNEDGKSFEFRAVDEYPNNERNRFIVFNLLKEPTDDDEGVIVVFQVQNDVPIEAMMNFISESGTVWEQAFECHLFLVDSIATTLIEKDIMHDDDYIDKYFFLV